MQNEQISWWFMFHTKMQVPWTCIYHHHSTSDPVWNHPVTGVSVLTTLAMLVTIIGVRRKALVIDLLPVVFNGMRNPWRNHHEPPALLEIKVIQLKVLLWLLNPGWLLNLGVFQPPPGKSRLPPCLHVWNPHADVPHSLWISRWDPRPILAPLILDMKPAELQRNPATHGILGRILQSGLQKPVIFVPFVTIARAPFCRKGKAFPYLLNHLLGYPLRYHLHIKLRSLIEDSELGAIVQGREGWICQGWKFGHLVDYSLEKCLDFIQLEHYSKDRNTKTTHWGCGPNLHQSHHLCQQQMFPRKWPIFYRKTLV